MLIVNTAGIALIALIVWWFWLYKPREVDLDNGAVVVVVDNGSYQPAHIKLTANLIHGKVAIGSMIKTNKSQKQ